MRGHIAVHSHWHPPGSSFSGSAQGWHSSKCRSECGCSYLGVCFPAVPVSRRFSLVVVIVAHRRLAREGSSIPTHHQVLWGSKARDANETPTGDFLYLFVWHVRAGPERRLQRQGRQRQPCSKCRHGYAGPRAWQQCQWANHERAARGTTDQSPLKQRHTQVIRAAYQQLRVNNPPKTT
jgi:hypothetical protein